MSLILNITKKKLSLTSLDIT